ncbi:MAG: histidine kinase [Gammaproteobacteria bacterium]|nr:MAG: histidine kinase [Gammaproteobacteria bacterium]
MVSGLLLISISLLYVGFLFTIAYRGDKNQTRYKNRLGQGVIYSLSLAVYCTSWTFYGAVGRASNEGLGFLPIYLGPFLAFLFCVPLIKRILFMSKNQNITSIADFIASRYGKSQILAVMVTIIATIGVLPYIALQLKAVAMSYALLTDGYLSQNITLIPLNQDPAWYAAMFMAVFTVLFGTRHLDATEHHQGMVNAIAFESIVKLIAFGAVGMMVCYTMFDGFTDILTRVNGHAELMSFNLADFNMTSFVTQTIVAMFAIICLPRQFHVTMVENTHIEDIHYARYVFPAYLLLISIFVLPVAAAGLIEFPLGAVNTDTFVLRLPMSQDNTWLTVLAFIGGGSAATAMVIVSTVTLSTMICNEIVIPGVLTLFGPQLRKRKNLGSLLLTIRRLTILGIVVAAYGFYKIAGNTPNLTSFGLLSFVAAAQFAPALIGGALWRRGNFQGAMIGLLVGFSIWCIGLLWPAMSNSSNVVPPLSQPSEDLWTQIKSNHNSEMARISQGIIWSLSANVLCYVLFSLFSRQQLREKIQVAAFFQEPPKEAGITHEKDWAGVAGIKDIQAVTERFLGKEKTASLFDWFEQRHHTRLSPGKSASPELLRFIETQLASVIGSSTAKVVLDSTLKGREVQIEDVVNIVDEASQVMELNRDLLQSAIENISLGISVVDSRLRLVAWNQRYLDLFNYPEGFVQAGKPIEDLIRFNMASTNLSQDKIEELVETRLSQMAKGEPHEYEREKADGSVLLIQGTLSAKGGYVTTFSDITNMRRTEIALKETNTYLEQRVQERTEELSILNEQLSKATRIAEKASQGKTRFLASASHDLLQPINAARLFVSALYPQISNQKAPALLLEQIDSSLTAAEEILSTLLDISKMDAGIIEANFSVFPLKDVLLPLKNEFTAVTLKKGVSFKFVPCRLFIKSDIQLLRRAVQNFLANATRYTDNGKLLLGCRRTGQHVRIEVWDTGPGIPDNQLSQIFEEFKRLTQKGGDKNGLGLGLAIVDRISHTLQHPVDVRSWQGRGSVFSITVPIASRPAGHNHTPSENMQRAPGSFVGRTILCIDNEAAIRNAMKALLEGWECQVILAANLAESKSAILDTKPDLILADYQLDNDENGLDLMDELNLHLDQTAPGVLVTAVNDASLRDEAIKRGYQMLNKPVKPAALRALITRMLKN